LDLDKCFAFDKTLPFCQVTYANRRGIQSFSTILQVRSPLMHRGRRKILQRKIRKERRRA
jgi:hypothetical protein